MKEETGLTPKAFYSADINEQFYEADRDSLTVAPVFVAFAETGAEVVLNEEHSDYRWLEFNSAIELVTFGGQRRILQWIEDEFVKRAPSDFLRIAFDAN